MCDPVSMVVGAVGNALGVGGSKSRTVATADPAAERAAADAAATTSANRKLAAAQARRREQGSLIARGAPQPTLGDPVTADAGLLGSSTASRSSTAERTSLMSRGSPTAITSIAGSGFSASSGLLRSSRQQAY